VTRTRLRLSAAHRWAVGHRIHDMRSLLQELRSLGYEDPRLLELEQQLEQLEQETGAAVPGPPRGRVRAALAQLHVAAFGLRPRDLEHYGELGEEARHYLEREAARLVELTAGLAGVATEGRRT
jgi:hypothetical protein